MLRPMVVESVPPETVRVAQAAFPTGTGTCGSPMNWLLCFVMTPLSRCSLCTHNRPCLPGGWRLSRSCHAPKALAIAKRRTPCAATSTGNMGCAWNSRLRDSTPRDSASFVRASWLGRRRLSCAILCSRGAATAPWSTPGAASGPTRRLCWPRCGPSDWKDRHARRAADDRLPTTPGVCLHSVGHAEAWIMSPRLAQRAWRVALRWAIRNARTLRTPGGCQRMPARLNRR